MKRLTVFAERRRVYWVLWAELLKRTFRVDVTRCPQCQGSMQVIAQLSMLPYDGGVEGVSDVELDWGLSPPHSLWGKGCPLSC